MSDLETTALACKVALSGLEGMFRKEARLTLIVRLPGDADADFLVTADDLAEVKKVIERSVEREAARLRALRADGSERGD